MTSHVMLWGRWSGWRGRVAWCFAALALAIASAAGKAPPEWVRPYLSEDITELKRGQPAVWLIDYGDYRYIAPDRVKKTMRGALRITTEEGRKLARCRYPYNPNTEKITSVQAWLISPDGKASESVTAQEFRDAPAQVGRFFWNEERTLSYSAASQLETGAVFAWEFQVESQSGLLDAHWFFPSDLPVAQSLFTVTPLPGDTLEWYGTGKLVPAPSTLPGSALRWEARHLPAPSGERPEGFHPTLQMVSVRPVAPGGRLTWPGFAGLAASIIEPRIVVTPEVKTRAEALTASKSTRWERVRALAEFAQKDISYLAITLDKDYLAGYRPHLPAEVMQNRFGDCKDKATLLVSLLRSIGEEGHVVLVFSGDPKAVQQDWPSAFFNHAIAGIAADDTVPAGWPVVDAGPLGRLVLFDATDPETPLGSLPPNDQGGFGLVASPKAAGLISLPMAAAEANRIETKVEAELSATGDLTVKVGEVSTGEPAVALHALRADLQHDRYTSVIESRLRLGTPSAEGVRWKDQWDALRTNWKLDFEFKAPRYTRRTGATLMIVNPQILATKARHSPWKTKAEGVVWGGPSVIRKEVRLTLPAGAVVDEVPDDWSQEIPTARARITYRRDGPVVICESELRQSGGFLDQAAYEARRQFLQKAQDTERRPVVLKLESMAK